MLHLLLQTTSLATSRPLVALADAQLALQLRDTPALFDMRLVVGLDCAHRTGSWGLGLEGIYCREADPGRTARRAV